MCDPVSLTVAAVAATTTATLYQGEKARKAQNQAADQARSEADQAFNRANPKKPDAAQMLYDNQRANSGGTGSTMLTGSQGIDPSTLSLGKSTLLGG